MSATRNRHSGPPREYMHMQPETLVGAFGQVVRESRIGYELSEDALALRTGLTADTVSAIESGTREPTLCDLIRLAQGLGIAPTYLLVRTMARPQYPMFIVRNGLQYPYRRLCRLGYMDARGRVQEHRRAYESPSEAYAAAEGQNATRDKRGLPPFEIVFVYVRAGEVSVRPVPGGGELPPGLPTGLPPE